MRKSWSNAKVKPNAPQIDVMTMISDFFVVSATMPNTSAHTAQPPCIRLITYMAERKARHVE